MIHKCCFCGRTVATDTKEDEHKLFRLGWRWETKVSAHSGGAACVPGRTACPDCAYEQGIIDGINPAK